MNTQMELISLPNAEAIRGLWDNHVQENLQCEATSKQMEYHLSESPNDHPPEITRGEESPMIQQQQQRLSNRGIPILGRGSSSTMSQMCNEMDSSHDRHLLIPESGRYGNIRRCPHTKSRQPDTLFSCLNENTNFFTIPILKTTVSHNQSVMGNIKDNLSTSATLEAINKLAVIAKRAFGDQMGFSVPAVQIPSSPTERLVSSNSDSACSELRSNDNHVNNRHPQDYSKFVRSIRNSSPEMSMQIDRQESVALKASPMRSIEYEHALARLTAECLWRRKQSQPLKALVYWNSSALPSLSRQGDLANANLATKVFLGGLPYDTTQVSLMSLFSQFGVVSVQTPSPRQGNSRKLGHAYLVFDNQLSVRRLLANCTKKGVATYYIWVPSMKVSGGRFAQVIPWVTEDNDWVSHPQLRPQMDCLQKSGSSSLKAANQKNCCIFIGGLHGEVSAEGLQVIMSQLFGPVLHAGIDTDCHGYPSGSARVTFVNRESFQKALKAEFVRLETTRFSKLMQIDPFVDEVAHCVVCGKATSLLCRGLSCLQYFCALCFEQHRQRNSLHVTHHVPLMRPRTSTHVPSYTLDII